MQDYLMNDDRTAGPRLAWIATCAVTGFFFAAPALRADSTVEGLTGNAVSGVGPYYQDVEDALRKFSKKDYSGALERLENAKKTVPRLAPAEVMMAQLYYDSNQPTAAVGMLEKVIQRVPGDPEAYVMLAERAALEGRLTEADLLFQKAAQLVGAFADNPKRKQNLQIRALTGAAIIYETRGDWKAARTALESLIKLDPNPARAHERLGHALFEMGDQKAAFVEFQSAAESDKNVPPAELVMATLFKDQVNSEKWLNFAIKKGGQDLRTQIAAGRFLLKANRLDEAKSHAEEAIKLDPESVDANVLCGLIARVMGDYATAQAALSKAHLMSPGNALVINNLALVLLELPEEENHLRALQFAELNMSKSPNNPEIVATYGWVNYRLNRRLEAERVFATVFNSNRVNSDMLYYLANFSRDRGQTGEAVKLLKEAINTTEPFGYRKPAQALLAELTKADKSQAAKDDATAGSSKGAASMGKDKADPAKSSAGKGAAPPSKADAAK
jgi:superkiller protein 3